METLKEVLVGRSTDFIRWTLDNYSNQINGQLNQFRHPKAAFERDPKDESVCQHLAGPIEALEAEKLVILSKIAEEQRKEF